MKRLLFISCVALLAPGAIRSQPQPYRVAFDLTSRDTLDQKAVLRWLKEVSASHPKASMEVVMYGKGFELVTTGRSLFAAEVTEAMKNPRVAFKVCEISLKNNAIDRSQLLPGVRTVPDGIYELVLRQQEHWGYIRLKFAQKPSSGCR